MNDKDQNKSPLNQALHDEQLEEVTGGGAYYPIEACPYGHTKIIKSGIWFGQFHPECKTCQSYRKYSYAGPEREGLPNYPICTKAGLDWIGE